MVVEPAVLLSEEKARPATVKVLRSMCTAYLSPFLVFVSYLLCGASTERHGFCHARDEAHAFLPYTWFPRIATTQTFTASASAR